MTETDGVEAGRTIDFRIRVLEDADLEQVIHLWEEASAGAIPSVFSLAEAMSAVRSGQPALVAIEANGTIVGAIAARLDGDRAWLLRWVVNPTYRRLGIGSSLLRALERRLRSSAADRVGVLLRSEDVERDVFEAAGYVLRADVVYAEKKKLAGITLDDRLEELGAEYPAPGRWEAIGGMHREKELIERRVILPLMERSLAARHGVVPPTSLILFGPPGTGKTTFAQAIAARLSWPFVEIRPTQLGVNALDQAGALRQVFSRLRYLDNLVAFIDEVEEIASNRRHRPETLQLTNELLKLIPKFRESGAKLLVCATNVVHDLDPAFIRAGRFDYLLPVGPPTKPARHEIWGRYVVDPTSLDLDALAQASELFSVADIQFAAGKAAQVAFERSVETGQFRPVTTEDCLRAIADTRPTLSLAMVKAFEEDVITFSRW